MTTFTLSHIRSCDACGRDVLDKDEILCRKCKPSLQKAADIAETLGALHENQSEIDSHYHTFTRTARGKPAPVCLFRERERLESKLQEIKNTK